MIGFSIILLRAIQCNRVEARRPPTIQVGHPVSSGAFIEPVGNDHAGRADTEGRRADADTEDQGAGGHGAAPVRAQLRAQGNDPRPRRGRPHVGPGRQRIRRLRSRNQRDVARSRRPRSGRRAVRAGGPALARQQSLFRGAGGASRRRAVRGVIRRPGLLLQLRCGGERGRDQARAQACERAPRRGEERDS